MIAVTYPKETLPIRPCVAGLIVCLITLAVAMTVSADRNLAFEGWFSDDYVVIFDKSKISDFSQQYKVQKYLPGFEVMGLVGWDDLIVQNSNGDVFRVPSVPMLSEHLQSYSPPKEPVDVETDERFVGKIKWYVQPLVFGGSPTDDDNMVWLSLAQHAEVVVWWNNKYQEASPSTE